MQVTYRKWNLKEDDFILYVWFMFTCNTTFLQLSMKN